MICVEVFFQSLPDVHNLHPLIDYFIWLLDYFRYLNSTLLLPFTNLHHGAVGSASAWQTRYRGFEPGQMRFIFREKYPGA